MRLFGVNYIVVVAAVELDQLWEVLDQVEEETTAQILDVVAYEIQTGQNVLVANTKQFCRLLQ
jgi:hypothetical protein